MKGNIVTLLIITLFTGCVSAKKMTKYVEPKFQDAQIEQRTNDYVFDFTALGKIDDLVVSTTMKSQFIPAILYWQWNKTIQCEIDPLVIGQSFQESFVQHADSLHLQEKLGGQKLEIKLTKTPNSFVYTYRGNTIIFIIAYAMSNTEAIFPQEEGLSVQYSLVRDGQVRKEGRLNAINKDEPMSNVWKSTKKFTGLYVDRFKQNIDGMTREIVEKLLEEI